MLFVSIIYSQITLIPDPVFEDYLITIGWDSDGIVNGQVLTSDIENRTTFHLLGNPSITDLTGIEDFASLEVLDINSVNITELNLSENLNLKRLDIWDVSLESLDLSNNIALEILHLSLNSSIGFFTSNMDSLDLSVNTLLSTANISGVNLSFLDFSNNINLGGLELKSMDELTSVNLKSGNNENLNWLQILYNDSLQCVQVDDPEAVIAGINPPYDYWVIQENTIITEDCNLGINEDLISIVNLYPNPAQNTLNITINNKLQITQIQIYDIIGNLLIATRYTNQINVSHLSSGVLFIKIHTNKGTFIKRFVKE